VPLEFKELVLSTKAPSAQSSTALGKTSPSGTQQPKERHAMTLIDILRDFAANNGTDVEITVTVSDPANARITGTLVECEEDFVKLVNVRPYAALDRYVAIQHIVWVNRQPR
jgi:hypothetical protein